VGLFPAQKLSFDPCEAKHAPKVADINLPWQRRVYSGRFLSAVCTTSKSRLPRQYMKVGRKSAAMLGLKHDSVNTAQLTADRHTRWAASAHL